MTFNRILETCAMGQGVVERLQVKGVSVLRRC